MKYILLSFIFGISLATKAQIITFEHKDYHSLGVYDTWEASPFRTGKLKGNYAVVDNHLNKIDDMLGRVPNASHKVLAVQRSRYGSNTFGVRINLNESFKLNPTTQYLHVMINRPYSGRVMVIGLGKRTDLPAQSPETEQFWAMSTTDVSANKWIDVVLPIKGNGGIDIYSLVVVPDCESPHSYTTDEICYIDNIEINNNPVPRFVYGHYITNFTQGQISTRNDRHINSIRLLSPTDGEQNATIPSEYNTAYVNLTNTCFKAKAGEQITASFNYTGSWMHGYIYIDKNKDGKFTFLTKGDDTQFKNEMMSYSFYGENDDTEGYNSIGDKLSGNNRNVLNPPSFILPHDLTPGIYRLRYKVDWNNADPGGAFTTGNNIIDNGGGIVDILLNIHADHCLINDANRNGEVLAEDNSKLSGHMAPYGEPFTIVMRPEKGFDYSGIIVKHGYNLANDSIDMYGNIQWSSKYFDRKEFDKNHKLTIPAECIDGDVEIEGLFIEKTSNHNKSKKKKYNFSIKK